VKSRTLQSFSWPDRASPSKAVQQGAVIRRKARAVERLAAIELFMAKINRRGFRAVENSGQIIIICSRARYAG
jgi:hypothetical protein